MKQGKALAFFIAKKYGGFAMTNEQRREIFELRSEGLGYTEIGKRVGLQEMPSGAIAGAMGSTRPELSQS